MMPCLKPAAIVLLILLVCLGIVSAPPAPSALINVVPGIDPTLDKLPSTLTRHLSSDELAGQFALFASWATFKQALASYRSSPRHAIQLLVSFISSRPAEPEGYEALSRALSHAEIRQLSNAERAHRAASRLYSGEGVRKGKSSHRRGRHRGGGRLGVPDGLTKYAQLHETILDAGWKGDGLDAGGARFLVCQPSFGLGNRVNAIMMCAAAALATKRALLVHWNCFLCHDQVAYPISMDEVFGASLVDWRVDHLSKFYDNETDVRGGHAVIEESTDPSPSFDLGEYLSTSMLDAEGGKPVVVMNCFRFHPAILDNPHHSSIFRDIIGSEGQGVDADIPGWYASVGLLITGGPPLWAEVPLKSLEILLRGRLPRGRAMLEGKRWQVAGAQMRFTLPEAYHGPSGAEEEIESILTCALDAQRSSVRSILISCDSHRHRERIIAALRRSLGCVRSAWGDIQPLGIGNGGAAWCQSGTRGDREDVLLVQELIQNIPEWTRPVVVDFEAMEGFRIVMFNGDLRRSSRPGAMLAVLEMWALASLPDHLVVTEQSSFVLPASAMFPRSSTRAFQRLPNGTSSCVRLRNPEPSCGTKTPPSTPPCPQEPRAFM